MGPVPIFNWGWDKKKKKMRNKKDVISFCLLSSPSRPVTFVTCISYALLVDMDESLMYIIFFLKNTDFVLVVFNEL